MSPQACYNRTLLIIVIDPATLAGPPCGPSLCLGCCHDDDVVDEIKNKDFLTRILSKEEK
jgi:hypothetical protein